jgi:hypothetical protein
VIWLYSKESDAKMQPSFSMHWTNFGWRAGSRVRGEVCRYEPRLFRVSQTQLFVYFASRLHSRHAHSALRSSVLSAMRNQICHSKCLYPCIILVIHMAIRKPNCLDDFVGLTQFILLGHLPSNLWRVCSTSGPEYRCHGSTAQHRIFLSWAAMPDLSSPCKRK